MDVQEEVLRAIGNEIVRIRQATEKTLSAVNWLLAIAVITIAISVIYGASMSGEIG